MLRRKLSITNLIPWHSLESDGNHVIASLSGHLWKMKRVNTTIIPQWNKRWCTIEGTYFKWYSSNDSIECSGTISLKSVTCVKKYKHSTDGTFTFVITCPTRQMILRASSEAEMEKWMRALVFQADLARGGNGTSILGSVISKSKSKTSSSSSLEDNLAKVMKQLNDLEQSMQISSVTPSSSQVVSFYDQAFAQDDDDDDDYDDGLRNSSNNKNDRSIQETKESEKNNLYREIPITPVSSNSIFNNNSKFTFINTQVRRDYILEEVQEIVADHIPKGTLINTDQSLVHNILRKNSSMNLPLFDSDDENDMDIPEVEYVERKHQIRRGSNSSIGKKSERKSARILGTQIDQQTHQTVSKKQNPVAESVDDAGKLQINKLRMNQKSHETEIITDDNNASTLRKKSINNWLM
jgi:hypothetical protein